MVYKAPSPGDPLHTFHFPRSVHGCRMGGDMSTLDTMVDRGIEALRNNAMKRVQNEEASKAFCAQLNTAAFTDKLGRVRISDGVNRVMVPNSEHDRIKDGNVTPLSLVKLGNFEDDVYFNGCLAIFLGWEDDGKKFLYRVVKVDPAQSDTCTCPGFCHFHYGKRTMKSAPASCLVGIVYDGFSVRNNMRHLVTQHVYDPFKENYFFVLCNNDKYILVAEFESSYQKNSVWLDWCDDFLPRNVEIKKPAVQSKDDFMKDVKRDEGNVSEAETSEEEDAKEVSKEKTEWMSLGFFDKLNQCPTSFFKESYYHQFREVTHGGSEPPCKKPRLFH